MMGLNQTAKKKLKSLESGQALIEYVALLFVGTLMVLGLVYQFNDAFRQYLDAWFGSDDGGYLFCLIQNGYLPGESGICTPPVFNLKNGKAKSSIGGTSGAGGNASSNANSAKGGNGFTGGAALGGEGANGQRGLIPFGSNSGGKGRAGSGGSGSKESTGNADGSSSSPVFGPRGGSVANTRGQYRSRFVPITGDDSGGSTAGPKTVPATERDLKPQSRFVATEKARKKQLEDDDFNNKFTFGKILKYLIIIFILFSIFFFIGSQLLAISQGSKKRQ
jgi:hypothetical protein